MKKYLKTLIEEKGKSLDHTINIEGHFGLTYGMLVDFIEEMPVYHEEIKTTLIKIDFYNGDVFHYLQHLAVGMIEASN